VTARSPVFTVLGTHHHLSLGPMWLIQYFA
jgi:hypothetical protein